MTIRRYAVLDADGVKVNTITADENLVAGDWYPGYGAALVDEGELEPEPPPAPPPVKPETWGVLDVKITKPLLVGDRIDFKTGIITSREDISVAAVEAEAVKP